MRVMVLVKARVDSEAGVMPSTARLEAMGRFNEELVNGFHESMDEVWKQAIEGLESRMLAEAVRIDRKGHVNNIERRNPSPNFGEPGSSFGRSVPTRRPCFLSGGFGLLPNREPSVEGSPISRSSS